jgi:hypothetical protein
VSVRRVEFKPAFYNRVSMSSMLTIVSNPHTA